MTLKRVLRGFGISAAMLAASSLLSPSELHSEGPVPPYEPGSGPSEAFGIPVLPNQPKFATVVSKFVDVGSTLSNDEPVTQATLGASDPALAAALTSGLFEVDRQGQAQVYIHVSTTDGEVLADLEAVGVTVESVADDLGIVQGRGHVRGLARAATLASVTAVTAPDYGVVNVGDRRTEGDGLLDFEGLRATYGVDGSGVRVGVISDGIGGLADAIALGDLPATTLSRDGSGKLISTSGGVTAVSFRRDGDLEGGLGGRSGAEGTAMLEIIHDIAPGAELHFANFRTSLEFMEAVNYLASVTDVVVDDVGWFTPPYDQTSAISSNTAAALNMPGRPVRAYTVAVGNQADSHYEGTFVAATAADCFFPSPTTCHLFDGSVDTTDASDAGPSASNGIFVKDGGVAVVFLSWGDVFGATRSNYALCVFQSNPSVPLGCSKDSNWVTGQPAEVGAFINNTGEDRWYDLVIANVNGASPPHEMELFVFGGELLDNETRLNYNTARSSVPAQSDAGGGVLAAGAVNSSDPGTDDIASYSSRGPTNNGVVKPDVTAVDEVSVTGSGGFPDPFHGTSAAAPHVAGLEALLLDLAPGLLSGEPGDNPGGDRSTLRNAVTSAAVDLGASGVDNIYGYGRINGMASAASLVPGQPANVSAVGGNDEAQVTWTPPSFTGAGPMAGYTVVSSPGGVTASVSATSTVATVTGLTSGTTYTFSVTAANSVGANSLPSAPSNVVLVQAGTPFVNLALTEVASPNSVTVGDDLTYTLTVSNVARTTATSITLVDTLASSTAFQAASSTRGNCGESGGIVRCNLGDLGPGDIAIITIVVIPTSAGTVVNSATISSAEFDTNLSDNADSTQVTVVPMTQVDLSIAKTTSPDPVTVGNDLTYTLTVTNAATATATEVTLVDTLATSMAFKVASSTQGTCGETGGTVTCNLGELAPGGVAISTIVVTPTAAGPIGNSASVSSAEADSDPSDNTDSESTIVGLRYVFVEPVVLAEPLAGVPFDVNIRADSVQDLAGVQFTLGYDPSVFTFVAAEPAESVLDCLEGAAASTPGSIGFGLACAPSESGAPLDVWRVTFTSDDLEVATTTQVTVSNVTLGDSNLDPIPSVGGEAQIALNQRPCGDISGDGVVNILDAIRILRIAVGLDQPTAGQLVLGDLTGDRVIDVRDAILGVQVSAGLTSVASCG